MWWVRNQRASRIWTGQQNGTATNQPFDYNLSHGTGQYRKKNYATTELDELMPADWVPEFNSMPAPIVPALNNKKLRIPGYALPVKYEGSMVYEFLLVPYMGACIHVPPPPANQMVYGILKEPLDATGLWDPVWASGLMKTESETTEFAVAGYKMLNASVKRYTY